MKKLLFSFLCFLPLLASATDFSSPLGTWQTLNDQTQEPSSLITISEENHLLVGKITRLLAGSHFKAGDRCSSCPGDLKDKPILGLRFLWGFVADKNKGWTEGSVLDPKNGKIYKGNIKLIEEGKKMELRGYWGPFWRTQVWTRVI